MRIGFLLTLLIHWGLTFSQSHEKEFVGLNHKYVYLLRLANDSTGNEQVEQDFFCAFPDSNKELNEILNQQNPFNNIKILGFFYNLKSIDKTIYYRKYIDLYADGSWIYWDNDLYMDPIGLNNKLLIPIEAELILSELTQRSEMEISNTFSLMLSCSDASELTSKHTKLKTSISGFDSLEPILNKVYIELIESEPWQQY